MTKAAFFDVDGTLTTENVWKGLMAYFKRRNMRSWTHRIFLAVHMPLIFLRKANLISESGMRKPWASHLAWYFRGMTLAEAQAVWDFVAVGFLGNYWREDIRAILDQHRADGDVVVLVSSGPLPMLERIAQELGANFAVGTPAETKNGRYTGRSLEPVCIDQYKAILTKQLMEKKDVAVDYPSSFAYADAVSDLGLLEMAGNPVAVYPKEGLRAIAKERGWKIIEN